MMTLSTTGTIRYKTDWRVVVEVDPEIPRYYSSWVLRRFGIRLLGSRWAPHITVVRKEEPESKSLWGAYEGEQVRFNYSVELHRYLDSVFWHLDVDSPRLLGIREELGLSKVPKHPLHITVGRESVQEKSNLLWVG